MLRTSSPLQPLLLRSQQFAVLALNLGYMMFALMTGLISPPEGPPAQVYLQPKFGAALVALLTAVAAWLLPKHLRLVALVSNLLYLVVVSLEVPRIVLAGEPPIHLALWFTLDVLVTFLVFGTRWGTWLNAASLAVIFVSLLRVGHLDAARVADWLTTGIVMSVTGLIAFSVVSFIENNMTVHAEDSQRLLAARQDALTDVYGRGATEEELDKAMEHARKTNAPLSVIVTDIDHFKQVNDRHGHTTGDDVLRAVAKRLRRNVGGIGGLVGRWGGEEFIILLPGVAKPDALVLAERLRREISDQPLAGLDITASFGVASYRGPGDTTDQLFGRADMAMYEAKRSGRNAVR